MTAVKWLIDQIKDTFHVAEASEMNKRFESIYKHALEMEEQQRELPNVGRDTAEYIDRNIIEAMKEIAKYPITFEPDEISDGEIGVAAREYADKQQDKGRSMDCYYDTIDDFIFACKWYREQLKQRK